MFDINKAKEYASAHAYKELLTYFVSTSGLEKSEIAYIIKTDRSILGMCLKGTAKITDKMIANLLVYLKLPLPENINSNDILYNEAVAMKLATEHRYPELLSYYIKTSALSRKKIASLLECSRRSLMRYEEKNRKIPKEVITKLLTLMGLSVDEYKKYQRDVQKNQFNTETVKRLASERKYQELLEYYVNFGGHTKREISERLSCSLESLDRYLNGTRVMPDNIAMNLLRSLNLPTNNFVHEEDPSGKRIQYDENIAKSLANEHKYADLLNYYLQTVESKADVARRLECNRSSMNVYAKKNVPIPNNLILKLLNLLNLSTESFEDYKYSQEHKFDVDKIKTFIDNKEYAELLEYYFNNSSYSNKELYEKLKCSDTSMRRYIRRERNIPEDFVDLLVSTIYLEITKFYQGDSSNKKNKENTVIDSTNDEDVNEEVKPSEDTKILNGTIESDEEEIVEEGSVSDEIKENDSASADFSATVSESESVKSNESVNDETAEEKDTEADSASESSDILNEKDADHYDITKDIDLTSMFTESKDGDIRFIWRGNYTLYNSLYLMMNANGWSKEKVAADLKIDVNALIDYMCGREPINKDLIPMILTYFKIKLDTLFPELSSYDFGETYLRLEIKDVIYNGQSYSYEKYYCNKYGEFLRNAFRIPLQKYDRQGLYLKSCKIDELTMDEYYNINPYYIYNERKHPVDFNTELKLPKGYQIKKELCYFKGATLAFRRNYNQIITNSLHENFKHPQLEDKWNKNNTTTPFIATGFYVEVRNNNNITLRLYNQDNLRRRISLAKYYKSDSPLYQKLKDADYTKSGKLIFIGGSGPENQYIIWPDNQIISLAEENYEWFKEFDITFDSYGAIGNVPVYICKEEDEDKKIAAANEAVSELLKNALPSLSESKSKDAKVSTEISESYEAEQIESVADKINKTDNELNSESASESVLVSEQKDFSTQTEATIKPSLNAGQEANNETDLNAEGSDDETVENIQDINVEEDYEQFDPNDPGSFHKEVTNCDGNLCLIWRGEKDTLHNTFYMYRRIREMSIETAAELLDVDPVQLMKLECGLIQIDKNIRYKIITGLKIPFESLFPELNSYDGNQTFIRSVAKYVYINGKKYDPLQFYCPPDRDLFIDSLEWPIAKYDYFSGELMGKYMPNDLTVDEYYSIPDLFLYDYDNDKEFEYKHPEVILPRNYEIIKAYYFGNGITEDIYNRKMDNPIKLDYIKTVEVFNWNQLRIYFKNGYSIVIKTEQYAKTDSVWYVMLRKKKYLEQYKIEFIGGYEPENQYLVWPDGQIICIVEHFYKWYKYFEPSFSSHGKCGMFITYSKK